jgi:ATP-binding cassette subfamily C protein CydC
MLTLRRIGPLLRPLAGWIALAIGLGALAMLANIALLALSGWFITAMAMAGLAGVSMNYFTPGATIRALAMTRTAGRYAERVVGHEATLRVVATFRPWLFARLLPLAPTALADLRDGDLLSRLRGDVDRLELVVLRVVAPIAVAGIVLTIGLGWLAVAHAAIAAAVAPLLVLAGLLVPLAAQRYSACAATRLAEGQSRLAATLVDHVEGLAELAVYDPEQRHLARLLAESDAVLDDEMRLANANAFTGAMVGFCAHLALVLAMAMAVAGFAAGALTAPQVPMLALFSLALFEAVAPLPLALQFLPAVRASMRRLLAVAERAPAVQEPECPVPPPASGVLRFERVGLRYPGATDLALRDIDLAVAPGRMLGIAGPSGAGKSSLVSLAMRFVPETEGRLIFAGTALSAFDGDAWRQRIALLPQDAPLLAATIRTNLQLAAPDAGEAEMWAACELAGILPIVLQQPEGLDTFVGAHGTKVSGGEARRIALARALLKPAPILILDEPTEGLDPQAALSLLQRLRRARTEQAILVISHDEAVLRACDSTLRLVAGHVLAP